MGYRYIGAKTKISEEILAIISSIVRRGSHVADLMCGTGSISAALRENEYIVTAADIMNASYHHARVLLLLDFPPPFLKAKKFIDSLFPHNRQTLFPLSEYEKILVCLNSIKPTKGYFWKEFCIEGKPKNTLAPRNYFTPENAKKIDALRLCIKQLLAEGQIDEMEHSLLIHDLIMATNDIANIAGTYGHFLSKLVTRAKSPLVLKPTIIKYFGDSQKHTVLKGYAEDLASNITCDLCYLDPPYMKRQYAANYHILETLAREDEPEAIGASGLRPWRDQYSNFCTKTKIHQSFRTIFSKLRCSHFLISYSEDGLLPLGELKKIFSEFGRVTVKTFKNKRFKSNDSKLSQYLTEYLFHIDTIK